MSYDNDRLGAALKLYLGSNPLPMHMPGHKRNPALITSEFYQDITEIQGFDNLHSPNGLLKDLESAAAVLWKAAGAFISVGGSTAMILSAIAACNAVNPGSRVLVAMNCHLSVWHALELTGNEIIPLMPVTDPALPFAGPVNSADIASVLLRDPLIRTVIITSPTYEGVISDTEEIYRITRKYDATLIVDCAHGSHLGLDDTFWGEDVRGDIVIKSLHKTLNAPTQTALMLTYEACRVPEEVLRHYIDIFETSSPSYILLKGVSHAIALINSDSSLMNGWESGIVTAEQRLAGLKNYRFWQAPVRERSKLVLLGDGIALADRLHSDFNIECEAAFATHLIAMTGIGDTVQSLERFTDAVRRIDDISDVQSETKTVARPRPVFGMNIRDAARSGLTADSGRLDECAGRICGEYLFCYPPGVPLLVPGEVITQDVIDYVGQSGSQILKGSALFDGCLKVLT